ncbi:DUF4249 domain-containing protein [Paracrocinitomix mangrovi]|uniref:DUF4249 domain-containing protein n=1 Tax=Paracrocinitomix mangrovi TaxID=2862509 RepID=UPI001C8D0940|nr:DUF4249 domain-containing protein [Paracrocinitomix mangrovi]UKN03357.1 DUF4249 domain-containing protein [Paracrocinitomix mangrovi]
MLLTAATFLFSCEKVIEVPIDDQDQAIVVEAVMKDRQGASFVKLSKTSGIYEPYGFEKVSGASVVVSDDNANQFVFVEDIGQAGVYFHPTFVTQENTTYNISITVGENIITGSSFTKSAPVMDSIYVKVNTLDPNTPPSNWVYYHSTDNVNEQNFYRLRIWVNSDESNQYYMGNDFYINGETYEAQFIADEAYSGDTILVEMEEMDEQVYNYYYGLSNTLFTGAFSPAPANPPSNLSNSGPASITGVFAAFMTDTLGMIVP